MTDAKDVFGLFTVSNADVSKNPDSIYKPGLLCRCGHKMDKHHTNRDTGRLVCGLKSCYCKNFRMKD